MKPIISFCIPTFNRSKKLTEAVNGVLESIDYAFNQGDRNNYEIIISDNDSSDETKEICLKYSNQFQTSKISFRYIKNKFNIGPSNNLINIPKYSNATYVWFLSDDDLINRSAISEFLKIKGQDYDFIYATRMLVDKNLNISNLSQCQPDLRGSDSSFENGAQMVKKLGLEITTILGFFSSLIIKRILWIKHISDKSQIGEFGYLNILLSAIKNSKCYIIAKPCVLCRLEYRGFKQKDTFVWIDDYLSVFVLAYKQGYDEEICKKMTKSILFSFSKSFVIEKASGHRNGNLYKISKEHLWFKYTPVDLYFLLSLFPSHLLRYLYFSFLHLKKLLKYFRG